MLAALHAKEAELASLRDQLLEVERPLPMHICDATVADKQKQGPLPMRVENAPS